MKKYYKTKNEAIQAAKKRNDPSIKVWKMPKGTRHAKQYAVCDEIEFLNTYYIINQLKTKNHEK